MIKSATDSRAGQAMTAQGRGDPPVNDGARRPYTRPRILSSELLEIAAGTCDGSWGPGKTIPPCSPAYPPGS